MLPEVISRFQLLLLINVLFVTQNPTICQELVIQDTTGSKLINIARDLISSTEVCVLITLDESGQPRSRLMDPFPPEDNLVVWFGTNRNSRKVKQITRNKQVTVFYQDPNLQGYVSLHGFAELIDDPIEKTNRWKKEWEDFYPNREESYILIKVTPKWLEVLSYPHGINGDSITWQPPGVLFSD